MESFTMFKNPSSMRLAVCFNGVPLHVITNKLYSCVCCRPTPRNSSIFVLCYILACEKNLQAMVRKECIPKSIHYKFTNIWLAVYDSQNNFTDGVMPLLLTYGLSY